eukprot:TRINITY_DN8175_c0_g1_i1.p1 TRINITY_DN8175_c0_g1~~TRINITY_DN8175_c0_g1_i1.p1  ORF type:complete len:456 (+),score=86.54 TRINITY_DN8175_c0_g1_i1:79-1368(+)
MSVPMDAEMMMKREDWKQRQYDMKKKISYTDSFTLSDPRSDKNLMYVGGLDISFVKDTNNAVACFVVCQYPSLKHVETIYHPCIMTEPYMPGFLGFREVEHLKIVVNKFFEKYPGKQKNTVIMVDGNGILHYRGVGSATHLGVEMGISTFGVAKELLVIDGMDADLISQRVERELNSRALPFKSFPLVGKSGQTHGLVMRSARSQPPIYISIGHCISLATAQKLTIHCIEEDQRLPKPVFMADGLSREVILKKKFDFTPKKPEPKPVEPIPILPKLKTNPYGMLFTKGSANQSPGERTYAQVATQSKKPNSSPVLSKSTTTSTNATSTQIETPKPVPITTPPSHWLCNNCDVMVDNTNGVTLSCPFCFRQPPTYASVAASSSSSSSSSPSPSSSSKTKVKGSNDWMCFCGAVNGALNDLCIICYTRKPQ